MWAKDLHNSLPGAWSIDLFNLLCEQEEEFNEHSLQYNLTSAVQFVQLQYILYDYSTACTIVVQFVQTMISVEMVSCVQYTSYS